MTSFNIHNCPARYSTIIMAISMIILSLIEVQALPKVTHLEMAKPIIRIQTL